MESSRIVSKDLPDKRKENQGHGSVAATRHSRTTLFRFQKSSEGVVAQDIRNALYPFGGKSIVLNNDEIVQDESIAHSVYIQQYGDQAQQQEVGFFVVQQGGEGLIHVSNLKKHHVINNY